MHPIDETVLHKIFKTYRGLITVEDGSLKGGAGSAVLEFMSHNNYQLPIERIGIPHEFIDHGSVDELKQVVGLDPDSIKHKIEILFDLVGNN